MEANRKNRVNKSKIYCSVPQCYSYYGRDISFHKFPLNDKTLLQKWTNALKIGKPVSPYMRVCSKHFKNEDFHFKDVDSQRKRIKRNAVPSEYLPLRRHDKVVNKKLLEDRRERIRTRDLRKQNYTTCTVVTDTIHTSTDRFEDEINAAETLLQLSTEPVIDHCTLKTFEDKGVQVDTYEEFKTFNICKIIDSDYKLRMLTGIQNFLLLNVLVSAISEVSKLKCKIDIRSRILLTLMRIRLDLNFTILGVFFNISKNCVRSYFYNTLQELSSLFGSILRFPEKDEILANMPHSFSKFAHTRVVLDCTEIEIQKSACLKCRIQTYSIYKGRHTCKFLIGVAPSGLITFVSNAYGGRASDKAILLQEDLLSKLDPMDGVMVDKGFLIEKECNELLLKLIRPPFLRKKKMLSASEVQLTAEIARARVHVERVMQRIKQFRVCRNVIPWTLLSYINQIMTVVVGLTNFSSPILADNKF